MVRTWQARVAQELRGYPIQLDLPQDLVLGNLGWEWQGNNYITTMNIRAVGHLAQTATCPVCSTRCDFCR